MADASSSAADFAPNPQAQVSIHHIGQEQEPVIVVDAAMRAPQRLVDYAASEVLFEPASRFGSGYPGLLGPAPLNYVAAMVATLRPTLEAAFQLDGVAPTRATCNFSLVTLRPDELSLEQRLPHVDTVDPLQFAILHFLCDERFGGTAFYRQRSTGFETLTPERLEAHQQGLRRDLAAAPPPAAYVTHDTPAYAQIAAFPAQWDRVLVYRSRMLHSGQIVEPAALDADPRRGRLTANIFLRYAPA